MVILTIIALLLGILYGISGLDLAAVSLFTSHTDGILYILMFSVGISIGLHKGILDSLRQYHVKIFIIPFGIITASFASGILCGIITGYPLNLSTAITSGMGWYSLTGATVGNLAGAEPGSVAFLSNLMREIFSFLIIPYLAVKCNNYTCIAPAGATSEDTTLPIIMKYTNEDTLVPSVLTGTICSAFVPVLISLSYHFPLFQ